MEILLPTSIIIFLLVIWCYFSFRSEYDYIKSTTLHTCQIKDLPFSEKCYYQKSLYVKTKYYQYPNDGIFFYVLTYIDGSYQIYVTPDTIVSFYK